MNTMTEIEYELYHHGIKGMKWGRRRYQNPDGTLTPAGKKRLVKAQKKYDDDYKKNYKKNYLTAYNRTADYANEVLIPKINAKYSKIIKTDDWADDPNYGKYMKEYETQFKKVFDMKFSELVGERPSEKSMYGK